MQKPHAMEGMLRLLRTDDLDEAAARVRHLHSLAQLALRLVDAETPEIEAAAIGAIRLQADQVRWILTGK